MNTSYVLDHQDEHKILTGCKHGFRAKRKIKKAKTRNQYNQVAHPTLDSIWKSDENTRKLNTQESQEVKPFTADDHKNSEYDQEIPQS